MAGQGEESVWATPRGGCDDNVVYYLVEGNIRWGFYGPRLVHLVQRSSTRCSFFCPRSQGLVECTKGRMGIVGQAIVYRLTV